MASFKNPNLFLGSDQCHKLQDGKRSPPVVWKGNDLLIDLLTKVIDSMQKHLTRAREPKYVETCHQNIWRVFEYLDVWWKVFNIKMTFHQGKVFHLSPISSFYTTSRSKEYRHLFTIFSWKSLRAETGAPTESLLLILSHLQIHSGAVHIYDTKYGMGGSLLAPKASEGASYLKTLTFCDCTAIRVQCTEVPNQGVIYRQFLTVTMIMVWMLVNGSNTQVPQADPSTSIYSLNLFAGSLLGSLSQMLHVLRKESRSAIVLWTFNNEPYWLWVLKVLTIAKFNTSLWGWLPYNKKDWGRGFFLFVGEV